MDAREKQADGCPRCLKLKVVVAKKYGVGEQKFTLFLCRNCHEELSQLVEVRKLPSEDYWNIAKKFLRGESPYVV